jgi:hypothetical protein
MTGVAAAPRRAARWTPRLWRWHRVLAWVVALQVVAWVLGGALFAWLPFHAWVKAEDAVARPAAALPAGWAAALATATLPAAPVRAVSSVVTARGAAWHIRHEGAPDTWLGADGRPLAPPDEASARAFAQSLYRGPGRLVAVERLREAPRHLGIVREAGDRDDLWVVRFDDTLATRLYLDGRSGQLVAARNHAWVVYDFFWRLHVMDYTEGEDFNTPWLRALALAALALVATGVALLALSLRRRRRG